MSISLKNGSTTTRRVLSPRTGAHLPAFPPANREFEKSAPPSPLSPRLLELGKTKTHKNSLSAQFAKATNKAQTRRIINRQLLGALLLLVSSLAVVYWIVTSTWTFWTLPAIDFTVPNTPAGYINIRPIKRDPPVLVKKQTKYLAYWPHSGYHNQRIALENALTLAKLLDRTLLLPPCRFGYAVPYVQFDKLDFRINQGTKEGLEHCLQYDEFGILPRECIGFFDWTVVSWDLLVDTRVIERQLKQPIIDRWNGTAEWLVERLGIQANDTYSFKDKNMYQYRFYDSSDDKEPLEKFEHRIELSDLQKLANFRLLHVGSLFGTSRMRTVVEMNWEVRSTFRQAMVFRNPQLDRITDTIRDRLGGPASYYAVHMRIGDGIFQQNAQINAVAIMRQLLLQKFKFAEADADALLAKHVVDYHSPAALHKRAAMPLDGDVEHPKLQKRASNSRPQRPGAFRHAWPAPIPPITSRRKSPLHRSLTCRGPLYTNASHPTLKLNAPLFLATDSKIPTADPVLALFFSIFPCTFILSDFAKASTYNSAPVPGLKEVDEWKNAEDRVQLAQFLYPVIDMMIAAKARSIVGTPQSTFSRFAVDVLYQV